jgi:DNA polymerase/3'-5' exonuclease PolX
MNENARIAAQLREAADELEERRDNPFRIGAFRRAADTIEQWPRPLREIFEQHASAGLQELPGVGLGIAAAIAEMLVTGRWRRLELLRGRERVFVDVDEDGIEHDYVVIDTRAPKSRWTPPAASNGN